MFYWGDFVGYTVKVAGFSCADFVRNLFSTKLCTGLILLSKEKCSCIFVNFQASLWEFV